MTLINMLALLRASDALCILPCIAGSSFQAGFISLSSITDLLHCQSSTIAVIINHLI